ncbi:IclR family transcriptional regulator [Brevibacillus sp. NRS-1366]|uniref:IclR family transcriptional regulator n=1 Tax=Brevibacillus sp. NRS-1366 TaxID=3233899 RepID=UPI003D1FBA03
MDDHTIDSESTEKQYNVAMVDRAMKILDYMLKSESTAGISQLAKYLDLPKANVFRIISTLEKWGMVERDPLFENEYRLGKALIVYGQKAKKDINLLSVAKPVLKEIAQDIGETANIGVLHENQIVILHSEQGEASILVSILPPTCSLHNSSLGKVFLANMPDSDIKGYFTQTTFERQTANTITSYDEFSKQKDQIITDGYSLEKEEWEYGLSCIAVPIKDSTGHLLAALSVSGPSSRMELKNYDTIIARLKQGADEIINRLSTER